MQQYDNNSGYFYFVNRESGESKWEPPEGGFVPLSDEVLQEIQTIEAQQKQALEEQAQLESEIIGEGGTVVNESEEAKTEEVNTVSEEVQDQAINQVAETNNVNDGPPMDLTVEKVDDGPPLSSFNNVTASIEEINNGPPIMTDTTRANDNGPPMMTDTTVPMIMVLLSSLIKLMLMTMVHLSRLKCNENDAIL